MQILDPKEFSIEQEAVVPYAPIVNGFYVAFDKKAVSQGSSVSLRKELLLFGDEGLKPALVLDGANFSDTWCAFEFGLTKNFRHLKMAMRTFPMQRFFPRLYHFGETHDFDDQDVSDIGSTLCFERALIDDRLDGKFEGGTLALMLPNALWFSIAIFDLEIANAPD